MIYKKVLNIILALLLSFSLYGSTLESDSTTYKKFIPDYVKLQFAGGIGFLSAGVGYTFFKDKLDISLFYGYIPEYFTVDDLHSISLQFTSKLLKYNLTDNIKVLPLNFGMFAHHTFGSEYWVRLGDKYPKGYYWWYPAVNAGLFLGAEIKTKLFANKTPASGTAFYIRIGTRGLYLASKMDNSTIPVKDIIELGFGVAVYR